MRGFFAEKGVRKVASCGAHARRCGVVHASVRGRWVVEVTFNDLAHGRVDASNARLQSSSYLLLITCIGNFPELKKC